MVGKELTMLSSLHEDAMSVPPLELNLSQQARHLAHLQLDLSSELQSLLRVLLSEAVQLTMEPLLRVPGHLQSLQWEGGGGGSANPHAYDQIRDCRKSPNAFYSEKLQDSGRNRTYNLWGTDPLL